MPALSLAPATPDCRVVELRQYTLHPGQRDTLIDLFDREFVETQEAVNIRVIGQFRDRDDPDRFVWLRGFTDMAARGAALPAFYGGPVWAAHRAAANATMIDSDDVLLLQPAWPEAALPVGERGVAAPNEPGELRALVLHLRAPADASLLAACRQAHCAAAIHQAWYVTEPSANNFPRLPLREGEPVLVALALVEQPGTAEAWAATLDAQLLPWQARATQHLRLAPTAASALHA